MKRTGRYAAPHVLSARRGQAQDDAHRLAAWKSMIERCRATVCARCWHLGDEESEAMCGRFADGLAIVSTLRSIRSTFASTT